MKKKFFIFLLLIGLSACFAKKEHRVAIAILTPISHPSLEQMEKGFIETLEKAHPNHYTFNVYNAQGNKTLMHSEIEEIIRRNYALVCTLGTSTSKMCVETFTKKGIATPIVFTAVNDPVGFHIVASEMASDNMATGVKELLNFREELSLLKQCKEDLQSLILIYNPTQPGLVKDQQEISQLLEEMKIKLITVEVFHSNEIKQKLIPFMKKGDAMMVLKDNTVVAGLDAIVKLANQYQIPLIASDLDSPDKGAALGFGVNERDFGIEAAKKALLILEDNLLPSDLPITPITDFTYRINQNAAKQQGLSIPDFLLKQKGR